MYRTMWQCSVVVACAAGALAWMTTISPEGAVVLLVPALVIATCAKLLQSPEGEPITARLFASASCWGAGVWGCLGLMTWGSGLGVVVVALLSVLSPPVVGAVLGDDRPRAREESPTEALRCTRLSRNDPSPDPAAGRRSAPGTDRVYNFPGRTNTPWLTGAVKNLDDTALCFAWRLSYVALQQPLSLSDRLLVVQRRQEILDDLARRNPTGLAAWFASGARAAGDPTRYVAADSGQRCRPGPRTLIDP